MCRYQLLPFIYPIVLPRFEFPPPGGAVVVIQFFSPLSVLTTRWRRATAPIPVGGASSRESGASHRGATTWRSRRGATAPGQQRTNRGIKGRPARRRGRERSPGTPGDAGEKETGAFGELFGHVKRTGAPVCSATPLRPPSPNTGSEPGVWSQGRPGEPGKREKARKPSAGRRLSQLKGLWSARKGRRGESGAVSSR
ncbi:hypothetical protein SRHO_G00234480 [Serrasalmus rhombeus]